jgi:uncharacterized protein (TIGR02145 family)
MKNLYVLSFLCFFLVNEINSQTVQIGNQVWKTSNLDVSTFRNGDQIPEAKNSQEWIDKCKNKQPAFCYYNFDNKMGLIFGKIYNYYAISDSRGLAPIGFSVPTKDDWVTLWNTLCNYNDYVKLNGELEEKNDENWKAWTSLRTMVATKMCDGPKFETKVNYIEHGGYEETKWVSCNNCSYWTAEQKKNNPCTVCRNQRGWYNKTGKYIPKTQEKIEKTNQLYGAHGCTNESGFSARSGGSIGVNKGSVFFQDIYIVDTYWSRTQEYRDYDGFYPKGLGVYCFDLMNKKSDSPGWINDFHYAQTEWRGQIEEDGYYVRCLKD